jgi:hypothetical protein
LTAGVLAVFVAALVAPFDTLVAVLVAAATVWFTVAPAVSTGVGAGAGAAVVVPLPVAGGAVGAGEAAGGGGAVESAAGPAVSAFAGLPVGVVPA